MQSSSLECHEDLVNRDSTSGVTMVVPDGISASDRRGYNGAAITWTSIRRTSKIRHSRKTTINPQKTNTMAEVNNTQTPDSKAVDSASAGSASLCSYCGGRGCHQYNPPVPLFDRLFAVVPCVCKGGLRDYAAAYRKSQEAETVMGVPFAVYEHIVSRCVMGDKQAQKDFDLLISKPNRKMTNL